MIEVRNKGDALSEVDAEGLKQISARTPWLQATSALTGQGVSELFTAIARDLAEPVHDETITLSFDQGRQRAWLFERKLVTGEVQTPQGFRVAVRWNDRDRSQYCAL
jgi:GTP-binding protein HflX